MSTTDVNVQVNLAPTVIAVEVGQDPALVAVQAPSPTFTVMSVLPTGPRGPAGPAGPPGSAPQAYTHTQLAPAATWIVTHNLGYNPGGVAVVDSAGTEWLGEVDYLDLNTLTITFTAPFAGTAYLS